MERGEEADGTRRDRHTQVTEASPRDFCPKCRTHRPPGACELMIQKILNVYTDPRMPVPPDTPRPGAYLFQEQLSHLGSRAGPGDNQTQLNVAGSSSALPPITMRPVPPGRTQHRRQTCSLGAPTDGGARRRAEERFLCHQQSPLTVLGK